MADPAAAPSPSSPAGGASSGSGGGSSSPSQNQAASSSQSPPPPPGGGTPGEAAPATPAEPKRFTRKEKVNGQEQELSATEEELFAAFRHKESVHANARKVAEERKALAAERAAWQAEQKKINEDPYYHLRKDPRFDERTFHEKQLHKLLQEQNRDPRDLELSARDQRIQELEREREERLTSEKQAQEKLEEDRHVMQLGARFNKAIAIGGLPKSDMVLDLMAKAHFTAEEDEGLEISEAELATETRRLMSESFDNMAEHYADPAKDEELLKAFPKLSRRLHEALVRQHKKRMGGAQLSTPAAAPAQNAGPERRLTEREEFEQMKAKDPNRRIWRGI